MKRELKHTAMEGTPTVRFGDKPGCKFVGHIGDSNDTKFGKAYSFTILDGDAPIKRKDEAGTLHDVDVKVGDKVTVFASGQLLDKLSMAEPGEKIEIEYLGRKLNPKSGRSFNNWVVNVIE